FLLLLAFPPLEAAGVLQLMDRLAGTSFFLPSGLVVANQVLTGMTGTAAGATRAGGGHPLPWQPLFWFLARPAACALVLRAVGIGGLTGLPLGLAPTDIHLHDTYYVIGHFHYVVAPGTIFALFAGIYYWFPKATGRKMNDMLGAIHFWGSFICINLVFMPMFIQ